MRLAHVADVQHDAIRGRHRSEAGIGEQREHRDDAGPRHTLPHHQEHDQQHADDERGFDAQPRQRRRPRASLFGGAEIALDVAKSFFEERLAAGDLDVLDRAKALVQQMQLLLIQLALRLADALPRSAGQHDRHEHEREHDRDGHQGDRRRREQQHQRQRGDDHRFGKDVDRRAGDELIGDVGRTRHRLDQRGRAPLRATEIVGGEVAREQSFGGDCGRSIDRPLAQPLRPRQICGAQHVEDADAEREDRHERARIARRPPRPETRYDGRRSHLIRIDDEPEQPEHGEGAGRFDDRGEAGHRHEREPAPALTRGQPADHRLQIANHAL